MSTRNRAVYGTAWVPATPVPPPAKDWAHHAASGRLYELLLGQWGYASDRAVLAGLSEGNLDRLRQAARINLETGPMSRPPFALA